MLWAWRLPWDGKFCDRLFLVLRWLLSDDKTRSIAIALGLGTASSSCSYAAVALARSIFRKSSHFTAAMAFELASTNLVIELSIILIVLMGWQLVLAEFAGAPIMIVALVLLFRLFPPSHLLHEAMQHANRGVAGRMEGHAAWARSQRPLRNHLRSASSPVIPCTTPDKFQCRRSIATTDAQ